MIVSIYDNVNDYDYLMPRCENEGGQSHYFGCQLGAGKSLNLSNVFHPRQVRILMVVMIMIIMPSKMEVASQHCDTVPNRTKDILYTVKIEKIFIHDSRVQHPVQSSVRGTLTD